VTDKQRKNTGAVRRWKAVCAYDGGQFHGWQSQRNAVAVQDVLEDALSVVLGAKTRIHGSGRTDTGVHALGQVFHFDAAWKHDARRLMIALRTRIPKGIQITSLVKSKTDFHARFDATGKRYHYRLFLGYADPFEDPYCWSLPGPLDFDAMRETARVLCGRHDFAAYCALNGDIKETTVRDLRRFEIRKTGRRVRITLEADGFLYKMVRSLVGTLIAVGANKMTPTDAARLLQTGKRIPAVATAPAKGLFLEKVFYDK
jgi:tRNA pseudouridine38-40 synthase